MMSVKLVEIDTAEPNWMLGAGPTTGEGARTGQVVNFETISLGSVTSSREVDTPGGMTGSRLGGRIGVGALVPGGSTGAT